MPFSIRVLTLLALAALASTPALAAEGGFYVGGGVGQATLKDDPPNFDEVDEEDTAWKVYGGYRLGGFIPILDLAAEITYRDFGKPEGNNFEYEASGYDGSLLGIFTLGPIDLFARLGIGNYEVESNINGNKEDDDGTSGLYGLGAGFRISKINIRVEWERVEPEGIDYIDMYSLNAYWRF